ncbi:MAG TPA: hypothetical protein VFL69_10220 [Marmoricola sp.]|nr:hypothetical protein [Marmoricola sp.]
MRVSTEPSTAPPVTRPDSARGALGHQCPSCRRNWALTLIEHPSGVVVLCRYCSAVRGTAKLMP